MNKSGKSPTTQNNSQAFHEQLDIQGKPLYSVRDLKSGSFGAPFAAPTDGSACRMIVSSMEDPKSMLSKFASDFELYRVGYFNEDNGAIEASMSFVCQILSLKEAANEAKS